jgi:4-methylaminobutanoate oxidase (formaldehyde-forming)
MYTLDGKFILGTPTRVNGLVLAGGCCGSGVAASRGFGQSVAEIIAGTTPSIDLALYRPDRFGDTDTLNEAFRERCATARSGKSRGRADPIAA